MSYTSQELADMICHIDPTAKWVYNKYCPFCGKFLYPEELANKECKKCCNSSEEAIKRPIPFATSGTAIEKLFMWVKKKYHANLDEEKSAIYQTILARMAGAMSEWMFSNMDVFDYRQRIIDVVGEILNLNEEVLCHT